METRKIGIILNGVTGRMGTNQHLIRSILAIMKQGGIKVSDDLRLMPEPILTGRNENKLRALAEAHGAVTTGKPLKYTTDLDAALGDKSNEIFFDASGTLQRAGFVERAVQGEEEHLLRKADRRHDGRSPAPRQALRRRRPEERRRAGQALAPGHAEDRRCSSSRVSSATCSASAASSATGSSPATSTTSPPSGRAGTTATRTAAASSSTCSATGST